MFTKGQWIFAAFFVVAFIIAMIYAYKGDKDLHKKFYKGSHWVLLGFFIFIALLFVIKLFFKR